ncbi:MAG: hypothetical protein EHM35_07390 [Planctomycetaceae bacterium]|nr:MAG: hypothetical protein EHM35_07390 [Planctomycetaceae bacterium]
MNPEMIIAVYWIFVGQPHHHAWFSPNGFYPGHYYFKREVCERAISNEAFRAKFPPGTNIECIAHAYMNPDWRPQ